MSDKQLKHSLRIVAVKNRGLIIIHFSSKVFGKVQDANTLLTSELGALTIQAV